MDRPTREDLARWIALVSPPAAWLIGIHGGYFLLVPWSCNRGTELPLHLFSLFLLLLVVAGGVASRRLVRAGGSWEGGDASRIERDRFFGEIGLLGTGVFLLLIAGQWLAILILDPCHRL